MIGCKSRTNCTRVLCVIFTVWSPHCNMLKGAYSALKSVLSCKALSQLNDMETHQCSGITCLTRSRLRNTRPAKSSSPSLTDTHPALPSARHSNPTPHTHKELGCHPAQEPGAALFYLSRLSILVAEQLLALLAHQLLPKLHSSCHHWCTEWVLCQMAVG